MDNLCYFDPSRIAESRERIETDVLVYGGTSAGVMAAVKAASFGLRVFLAHPGLHVGGMTSGGLTFTDLGNKTVIGGAARAFYRRLGKRYAKEEALKFEPGVAEKEFHALLSEAGIAPRLLQYLDSIRLESGGDGPLIKSVHFIGGLEASARYYVDATYEGDLMAAAGVSYAVGRESNAQYGETVNGMQLHNTHQFDCPVSPYVKEGDPKSGLLPFVEPGTGSAGLRGAANLIPGAGDRRLQAYNFRVCMTTDPTIRIPFPKPAGYERADYELAARWLRGTKANIFQKFDLVTDTKTDTNNHGAVSTDFIGGSYGWPEGSYEERERIFRAHVRWQQGLHFFMANDRAVPEAIRSGYSRWGLASDEFADTGNWPHQLYIREARRMVSDCVVAEADCQSARVCEDPVAMGAYQMDSHNCRRLVVDGYVRNEGDVQLKLPRPYGISYRSIVPRKGECANLAVPVCASASHIAYGSLRMEPVFMMLSEAAACAIALAAKDLRSLRDVPYEALSAELLKAGQVLQTDAANDGSQNPE